MEKQDNKEIYDMRFKTIEKEVTELREKINTFDGIKEMIVELKIITQQQAEAILQQAKANEQRDKLIQEHSIILAKSMEVLRSQGDTAMRLDKKIEHMSKTSNVNLGDIGKNILLLAIGAIVSAILANII